MSNSPGFVACCPWCGDGTALTVKGNGLGSVALTCLECGCSGPPAQIEGDFSEADSAAIIRWSSRSSIPDDVVNRVARAANLAAVLSGGKLDPTVEVSIAFEDLVKLLRASRPNWNRAPEAGPENRGSPAVSASEFTRSDNHSAAASI